MTLFFHNEPWEFAPDPAYRLDTQYWNLWKTRRQVYSKLATGDHVVLVRTWPSGSTLVGVLVVTRIDRDAYARKADAIARIARLIGSTPAGVRSEPYTQAKPNVPGYFIAWTGRTVAKLNMPRPADLRFGGDGWLHVDDQSTLKRWGLDRFGKGATGGQRRRGSTAGRGQGRRLDKEARDAVEDHAMTRAEQWCAVHGFTHVANVSDTKPWDLEAGKIAGKVDLFVEVKGTTGPGATVEVTAGEVTKAREHGKRSVMIVVSDIALSIGSNGEPVAAGGTLRTVKPWNPAKADLVETRYRCVPRSSGSRR